MEIHSNSPKLYYGFKFGIEKNIIMYHTHKYYTSQENIPIQSQIKELYAAIHCARGILFKFTELLEEILKVPKILAEFFVTILKEENLSSLQNY